MRQCEYIQNLCEKLVCNNYILCVHLMCICCTVCALLVVVVAVVVVVFFF